MLSFCIASAQSICSNLLHEVQDNRADCLLLRTMPSVVGSSTGHNSDSLWCLPVAILAHSKKEAKTEKKQEALSESASSR